MAQDDQSEPVVFGPALEGLKRALGDRFTPQLRDVLRAEGVDLDKVQVAYSLSAWLKAIRVIAEALGGDVPAEERYRHLGRTFMHGFVETPIGFAALTAGKVFGVKRTLMRMGRNFKTAANYIESEVSDLGPKEMSIRTYVPEHFIAKMTEQSQLFVEYRQGVLQAVLEVLGAQGTVEIVRADLPRHDFTYRISWQ